MNIALIEKSFFFFILSINQSDQLLWKTTNCTFYGFCTNRNQYYYKTTQQQKQYTLTKIFINFKNMNQKNKHKFCRCTRAGLKQITCPSGLAFDIEKQTCDWKVKVTNCDTKESKSSIIKK